MKKIKGADNTHEIIYWTIEDDNAFIIEEFETRKEAEKYAKKNKKFLPSPYYIGGFKQIRDEDEDCLEETEIFYKEYK